MDFIQKRLTLGTNEGVRVHIDRAANVMLLTTTEYQNYKNWRSYHYYGGHTRHSPTVIYPPRAGTYYVVIDLGGRSGAIKHSIEIV